MKIFAVETSCDETSIAILVDGVVKSLAISSQKCHKAFGGIVPELASREHNEQILQLSRHVFSESNLKPFDIDIVCATAGPGLIGSLLVGLMFAETFAFAMEKPFLPINHIEAHIFSGFIRDHKSEGQPPEFPFISLVASGGHTILAIAKSDLSIQMLGQTRDDASGEAFDKTGKMLGLSYPSGPQIDQLSKNGDPSFHKFPRSLRIKNNLEFSFSGLKTSVRTYLNSKNKSFLETHLSNIAASIQEAIVDSLLEKTLLAAKLHPKIKHISVSGGVSANSRLRKKFSNACEKYNYHLNIPKPIYSTDNAAMIGTLAYLKVKDQNLERLKRDYTSYNTKAFPRLH